MKQTQRPKYLRISVSQTGRVCFSLPSLACGEAARGGLRSTAGQAKAYPTFDGANATTFGVVFKTDWNTACH
jgi:hypothetical protein